MGDTDRVSFSTSPDQAPQPERLSLLNASSTNLNAEIMVAQANPGEPEKNSSTLGQMKDAFLHTAIQGPINGVTQIVDSIAGTNLKDSAQWFDAPQEAKFGSFDWHMQQIGNAGGIAADFFILGKAMKGAARGLSGLGFVRAIPHAETVLTGFAARPIVNATVTGAVYDGVFRESAPGDNLLSSRLQQVGIGAVTFGGLAATSRGLSAVAGSSILGNTVSHVVGNRVGSAFLAGAPIGALNAKLTYGSDATWENVYQGAYTYAFTGGIMGGADAIASRLARTREAPQTVSQTEQPRTEQSVPGLNATLKDPTAPTTWQMKIPVEPQPHSGYTPDGTVMHMGPWQRLKSNLSNSVAVDAISSPHFSFRFNPETGMFQKLWGRFSPKPAAEQGVTLFLDGGGVNGWRHIGVIKALEEARIKVDAVYGVSIGTIVASLLAKGQTAAQIEKVFFREFHNPLVKETLPKEPGLGAFWRRTDATPMVSHWVNEYGLRPVGRGEGTPSLHIGTFHAWQRKLHWFEGTDYEMVPAIKSSMGIPGVFSNLRVPREMLGLGKGSPVTMLDGGIRNVTAQDLPADLPIIISRLHKPEIKAENRAVNSKFLAWLERLTSNVLRRNLGAPDGDAVVIHPKEHEINSLAFEQPDSVYRNLMDDGYQQAKATLAQAIKDGKIKPVTVYEVSGPRNQIFAPALDWLRSLRPANLRPEAPIYSPVPVSNNDK